VSVLKYPSINTLIGGCQARNRPSVVLIFNFLRLPPVFLHFRPGHSGHGQCQAFMGPFPAQDLFDLCRNFLYL